MLRAEAQQVSQAQGAGRAVPVLQAEARQVSQAPDAGRAAPVLRVPGAQEKPEQKEEREFHPFSD